MFVMPHTHTRARAMTSAEQPATTARRRSNEKLSVTSRNSRRTLECGFRVTWDTLTIPQGERKTTKTLRISGEISIFHTDENGDAFWDAV
jgi:hypothetical protein